MTAAQSALQEPAGELTIEQFGDDALGRVQGLLFGDHAQRTSERIDSIEHRLSAMISDLRASVEMQLSQLGDQLEHEVQGLTGDVADLGSRIDQGLKSLAKDDTALARKVDRANEALRNRISQSGEKAATELASLREDLTAQTQSLLDQKVDRSALAALLRTTANDLDG